MNNGTALQFDIGKGEIFDLGSIRQAQSMALTKQTAADLTHRWEVECPQCQVHQMNAQVDYAATTGHCSVVVPRFVGTIRIVKTKVSGVDLAQRSLPYEFPYRPHRPREPINEIACQ